MSEYLLTWTRSAAELIGPFESGKAFEWARTADEGADPNPNNPHDTPCWQVMHLGPHPDEAALVIRIRPPDSGPLRNYGVQELRGLWHGDLEIRPQDKVTVTGGLTIRGVLRIRPGGVLLNPEGHPVLAEGGLEAGS